MSEKSLKKVDKQNFLKHLGSDLWPLLEVARQALNSWPIRMALEKKVGMTEERLEKLGELLETHITNTHNEGNTDEPHV